MLGYRTGETPVVQVHVKKPKPFKWLRKLFRRFKFKHARFDDGKYARGQKDIEKWHEESPLAKADYPDHRWQAVNKSRKSRSKNKDGQRSHNEQSEKPRSKRRSFKASDSQSRTDQSNILDMDLIKQVLENDPSYSYGKDTLGNFPSEVLSQNTRPSRLTNLKKRSKEVVENSSKTFDEVRASISGYFPIETEDSPFHSPRGNVGNIRQVEVEINSPVSAVNPLIRSTNIYPVSKVNERFGLKHETTMPIQDQIDSHVFPQLEITPCQHENDNDLNHLKVFEKKQFSKKPKTRKNKKKRPRRKGKYRELESTPSVESLAEPEVQVAEQFQSQRLARKCKPVKSRKQKKTSKKTRNIYSSLRRLVLALRTIPDAPMFHPKKYRGYTRFD